MKNVPIFLEVDMSSLRPEKLHIKFIGDADPEGPVHPRRYTLTHSDVTGNLFLSVGTDYDDMVISDFYTRIMRDEVLAELLESQDGPELHLYCHVSGGIVIGTAAWRYAIFQQHMRLVLQAFRYGDSVFFGTHPSYDHAKVIVHFHSKKKKFNRTETWGHASDYQIQESIIYVAA